MVASLKEKGKSQVQQTIRPFLTMCVLLDSSCWMLRPETLGADLREPVRSNHRRRPSFEASKPPQSRQTPPTLDIASEPALSKGILYVA